MVKTTDLNQPRHCRKGPLGWREERRHHEDDVQETDAGTRGRGTDVS